MVSKTQTESAESAWRQIRPVLDSAAEVVWWQARLPAFELTHVSQGVTDLLGFAPSRLTGDSRLWTSRIYAGDRRKVLRARELAGALGRYQDLEYRLTRSNGESVWVRESAVFDAENGYLHGFTIKVNDRKRTEERLAFLVKASSLLASTLALDKLQQTFARLMAGSMADVCVLELLGDDTEPGTVRAHGRRRRSLTKSLQADGPTLAHRTRLLQRLRKGQAVVFQKVSVKELSLLAANKRQESALLKAKPHAAMIVPMIVRSDLIGSVTLICFDQQSYTATDVQLAEDLCRRAAIAIQNAGLYARSEKTNIAKDEFLAIMSHELRSPLTTLYGTSMLLARGTVPLDSSDGGDLVQGMAASAERLVRLTDDLMLLARVQLGERPAVEPLNAKHLIEKVTEEFLAGHPERKIVVRAVSRIRPVLASETYVRQILLNLLGNADKYCPPGVPVTVKAVRAADEVIITVADAGVGLSQEEIERIFEPFYRADNAEGVKG